MKRVAIDCREFAMGKITGIGRLIANFVGYAAAERPDWRIFLFGNQSTSIPFECPGNVVFERFTEVTPQLWEQVRLPRLLSGRSCDLFISPYPKTCLFTSVPSVMTVHDLTWMIYPEYRRLLEPRRLLTKFYAAKASAVVTDSEYSCGDIRRILNVPADKISVCPGSVDPVLFRRSPDPRKLAEKYGIKGEYILYVGNANPHKNLNGLVAAYENLQRDIKDRYSLVLAGAEGFEGGPSSRVIPRVEDKDLPALYGGASLFVFPSFYEGFGLPPLEAMACSCPVVSSNASCLPEVLGDAALFFDPSAPEDIRTAIARVLADPGLSESLVVKGLARAGMYSPERSCSKLLSLAESVMSGRGG